MSYKMIALPFLASVLFVSEGGAVSDESDVKEDVKQGEAKSVFMIKKLSGDIQRIKKDTIALNKELRLVEEALMFPSSTKYSVFLSLDSGQYFTLESVKIKIDGKLVATHVYSGKQRNALVRGGVQRLYATNLNEGKHSISAFFTGLDANGRPYKRASTLEIEKVEGSQFLQLAVIDDETVQEPVFSIRQW